MDQARPDIPRRSAGRTFHLSSSPFFSRSFPLRLRTSRRCFFFFFHGGGLINETGQAKHYYLLYSGAGHWRGNVSSSLDYIPHVATKFATRELGPLIFIHDRGRDRFRTCNDPTMLPITFLSHFCDEKLNTKAEGVVCLPIQSSATMRLQRCLHFISMQTVNVNSSSVMIPHRWSRPLSQPGYGTERSGNAEGAIIK